MRRGFTLIEIIIVVGLIALIGGLIVVNANAILRGLGEEPVNRILQKAVREARFQAAYLKEATTLGFDKDSATFLLTTADGRSLDSFPTGKGGDAKSLDILFEQILPEEGLNANQRLETVSINWVTFRPDRSSTPFQVIIYEGNQQYRLRYDPFSDIVIDDSRAP